MCEQLTHPEDSAFGQLWSLCANATAHVLEIATIQRPPLIASEDGSELTAEPGTSLHSVARSMPGKNLFGAFTTLGRTLVIESFYFDLDTRSEVAVLQESTFATMASSTNRYHFFTTEAADGERLFDYVARAGAEKTEIPVGSYLGYSVIRRGRPIGRAIVPPHTVATTDDGQEVPAETVYSQVRTAVTEHVNLFGVPLTAVGVPFMEQDGSLLRCAHISAWICHYSAVLRGAVARRPTAQFPKVGDWKHATGRQFPSRGLTAMELSSILRNLDMPPELLDLSILIEPRDFTWADRSSLVSTINTAKRRVEDAQAKAETVDGESRGDRRRREEEEQQEAEADFENKWVSENLSAAICRYLNSGIPVILIRDSLAHTQVVVGYLRKSDLTNHGTSNGDGEHAEANSGAIDEDPESRRSDIDMFIVTDDQQGPFQLVSLDQLATEVMDWGETQLLAPLPLALWMSGDAAERTVTSQLPAIVASRLRRVDEWAKLDDAERTNHKALLSQLLDDLTVGADRFTIRTYATTGVDLKQSVSKRLPDEPDMVRRLSTLQLPKYVWVAELIDRDRRARGEAKSVVATVVLDATKLISVDAPVDNQQVLPLFIHFPGYVYVTPYGLALAGDTSTRATGEDPRDVNWSIGPTTPYATGRWSHERLLALSAERLANQSKTAVAVN